MTLYVCTFSFTIEVAENGLHYGNEIIIALESNHNNDNQAIRMRRMANK